MESSAVDPEHESKALEVLRAAERLLGDARFGGSWIDRTTSPPVIGVAAVDPSQGDVDAILATEEGVSWARERFPSDALMIVVRPGGLGSSGLDDRVSFPAGSDHVVVTGGSR